YGSGAQPDIQAMVEVNGGQLAMRNSLLRDTVHDAFIAGSGSVVTLENNVIVRSRRGILALAGSRMAAVNNTIDGNNHGVELAGANATLTNNLITNNSSGVVALNALTLTMSFNDVFNPGGVNYDGLPDRTGTAGNLSADPKYFNRAGGQYELRAGSP